MKTNHLNYFGLNITGGGARGSYQAGVLLALSEIFKKEKFNNGQNPVDYWSGVSAGAINAAFMTTGLDDYSTTAQKLVELWSHLKPETVYQTDFVSLGLNSAKWIRDLTFGPIFKKRLAHSLLNTAPLQELLNRELDMSRIGKALDAGIMKGVAFSAYSYRDARTVTFLQSKEKVSWDKPKRYSKPTELSVEHIMASCAIPLLFPTISVENEFFADGTFRNTSPISPIIQMGAKKILVLGVRGPNEVYSRAGHTEPGVAKVSGLILNSLFFDTFEIDLERIKHINEIVRAFKNDIQTDRSDYTILDYKVIRPSKDISQIAETKIKQGLPRTIEFLISGLGPPSETSELASYILFDSSFTRELIDLGYNDTKARESELVSWLTGD